MENTTGKIIINEVLSYLKIKAPTLAKNISVSYSKIYDIQREKTEKISGEVASSIIKKYPEFNYDWLLTGVGEMLKFESKESKQQLTINSEQKGVPYFENTETSGSIMSMFSDNHETPTFYINYQHFNDCTAYLQHVGDSMFPKYCSGEIVAVKKVFNFDIILWGEAYLIVTNGNANDLRTVKLLFQHEDDSKVILRASNPAFKGDTVINKVDIVGLYIVKGKITRNQL